VPLPVRVVAGAGALPMLYLEPLPVVIGFALLGLALVLQLGLRARTG
jgi:hypothetical protein